MSDTTNVRNPLIKWDGTIPAWGLVLLGITWAAYSWNTDQDLTKRLTVVEVKIEDSKVKTDKIESIASDVKLTKELLIRLEKQILPPVSIR